MRVRFPNESVPAAVSGTCDMMDEQDAARVQGCDVSRCKS